MLYFEGGERIDSYIINLEKINCEHKYSEKNKSEICASPKKIKKFFLV